MTGPRSNRSIVVVVPWYGGSHRAWADGWAASSAHDLTLVTLPAQRWRWRLQGAAIPLGRAVVDHVEQHGRPDLVVASSLVDVSVLRGIAGRALGDTYVVTYRHETQFAYPDGGADHDRAGRRDAKAAEWRSLVASDEIWFNSPTHQQGVAAALRPWLRDLDDPDHAAELEPTLAKGLVIPVGVDLTHIGLTHRNQSAARRARPLVLFNQRWEADKAPHRVINALVAAARAGASFDVALAGPQPPDDERQLHRAVGLLGDRVIHAGTADRATYLDLIHRSDLVVSDADHEFFGIAPIEAIAAGARPLYPRRQNYPDLVDHRAEFLHDGHDLVPRLLDELNRWTPTASPDPDLTASIRRFGWDRVGPMIDAAASRLIS